MLLALLMAVAVQAEPPRKLSLPHDWKVGTRHAIEIVKGLEQYEENELVSNASVATSIASEVIAKRADGYTLRWTFGGSRTLAGKPPTPFEEQLQGALRGLSLEFTTDAGGAPTGLVQPERFDDALAKVYHAWIERLGTAPEHAREVQTLRGLVQGIAHPQFHTQLMREPSLLFMLQGAELVQGERREYDDRLPNPFGGDPLPAKAYVVLSEILPEKRTARVDWRMRIDAEKASALLEASFRALAKRSGREMPGEASLAFDAIEDAATWIYDVESGWPRSLVHTRTTSVFGQRRIEHLSIDVKPRT